MQQLVRYIAAKTYRPLLARYLSGTRLYTYKNIELEVPPEVFHPGFFFSTKLLFKYLSGLDLNGKKVLELGAGSGLLSIYAAGKEAHVTAIDISRKAVETIRQNAVRNHVNLEVIRSDMFSALGGRQFDLILINPPYYKKDPVSEKEQAWYCGVNGEYFQSLFKDLASHMHSQTEVIMVLSENCDLQMIRGYAYEQGFEMKSFLEKRNLFETNFLFSIIKQTA